MKKLKLQVDDLAVDSFLTDPPGDRTGTVMGNSKPLQTCSPISCQYSCNGTCNPPCVTGYPDTCWVSWDPAARCAVPPSAPPCIDA